VFSDELHEVELVHGIAVHEFSLADVLWGFGLGGVVGLGRPVEGAVGVS
jgi:hypothetical protein